MDFTSKSHGHITGMTAIFPSAFATGIKLGVAMGTVRIMRLITSVPVPPRVTTFTAAEYFRLIIGLRKWLVALPAMGGSFCRFWRGLNFNV